MTAGGKGTTAFDELAKGLAQEVSRRHALRVLGGALVGLIAASRGGGLAQAASFGARGYGCQGATLSSCKKDCANRRSDFPGARNQDACIRVCCSCRKTGRGVCVEKRDGAKVVNCSCGEIDLVKKTTKACCEKRRCCGRTGEDAFCCPPGEKCCKQAKPTVKWAGCIREDRVCCPFFDPTTKAVVVAECVKQRPYCCQSTGSVAGQLGGWDCCERPDQCCHLASGMKPACCPTNEKCCADLACIPRTSTCCEARIGAARKVCGKGQKCCEGRTKVDCCKPSESCDGNGQCAPCAPSQMCGKVCCKKNELCRNGSCFNACRSELTACLAPTSRNPDGILCCPEKTRCYSGTYRSNCYPEDWTVGCPDGYACAPPHYCIPAFSPPFKLPDGSTRYVCWHPGNGPPPQPPP